MGESVIETRALRKEFRTRGGTRVAVHDLDLDVPRGGVHGFLGPNGSGKTTTIRMLLGLSTPTSGTMRLFGEPVPAALPAVMSRVGAVVESPKFAPNFTGRQNLALLGATVGRDREAVDDALEKVGLGRRAEERFKGYSLGMKQRLAIAATLLKTPDLLILDEPTNGLDPAGIREIRDLVKGLGASGVTVLLSSHILAEVQQVCDSVTIIGNGRLLASGAVDDLMATTGAYRLVADDPAGAAALLQAHGMPTVADGTALTVQTERPGTDISRVLGEGGVWLHELTPLRADLESVFLDLTADDRLGALPSTEDYR
jgi:ABC-2 type transport system ATP-binding protein